MICVVHLIKEFRFKEIRTVKYLFKRLSVYKILINLVCTGGTMYKRSLALRNLSLLFSKPIFFYIDTMYLYYYSPP